MFAIGRTGLDRAYRDCVVIIHDIDVTAGRACLDRSDGCQRCVVEGINQEVYIHKLVRKQFLISVRKRCPQLECSGGCVDLVIDRCQRALCKQRAIGPIKRGCC